MDGRGEASVDGAWERLHAWCEGHYPELLEYLNPGASEEEVRRYEEATDRPLPPDVRRSFFIHDGEQNELEAGVIFGLRMPRLSESLARWRGWRDVAPMFDGEDDRESYGSWSSSLPEGAIKREYTNPAWLPLTEDGGGNHLGIDLDPGPNGTPGQIITFGRDEDHKAVAAPTRTAFLHRVADDLESGNFVIDDGHLSLKDPPLHYHDAIKRRHEQI